MNSKTKNNSVIPRLHKHNNNKNNHDHNNDKNNTIEFNVITVTMIIT